MADSDIDTTVKIGDLVVDCSSMEPEAAKRFINKLKEAYKAKISKTENGTT